MTDMPDDPDTLRCPSCDAAIEVSSLMSAQITARLRGEVRAESEAREKKLVEQARAEAAADLKVELADGQARLAEAQKRIERSQAEALEVRAKQRELEEREARSAAAVREKAEALAAERRELERDRERIAAELREQLAVEGEASLKAAREEATRAAREEAAADLAARAERQAELEAAVKAAADRERDLLRSKRKLAEEREQLDLTVERQIAEERARVREAALKEAEAKANLSRTEQQNKEDSLRRTIAELQQKIEQGSQQTQGEALELELESTLARLFPRDVLEEVPKGVNGGDVLQRVVDDGGRECGLILWESKRTRTFQQPWLAKLRDDQRAARAGVAVLVTAAMPRDVPHMGCCEEVWVCSFPLVEATATAMRQGVIATARAENAMQNRHGKMEGVYAYLASPEFANRVSGIVETFATMRSELESERTAIQRQWAKRAKQIERAQTNAIGLQGDLEGLMGGAVHALEAEGVLRLDAAGVAASAPPPEERSIEELNLSTRARNGLDALGIETFADLLAMTRDDLLDAEGLGRGSVDEVVEALDATGFALRGA